MIQNALELYALDHNGHYPATTDFAEGQSLKSNNGVIYLEKIPFNDRATGACPDKPFIYRLGTNGQNYSLRYCLGSIIQEYQAGDCIAMPGLLCVQSSCDCNNQNKACCGYCLASDPCIK